MRIKKICSHHCKYICGRWCCTSLPAPSSWHMDAICDLKLSSVSLLGAASAGFSIALYLSTCRVQFTRSFKRGIISFLFLSYPMRTVAMGVTDSCRYIQIPRKTPWWNLGRPPKSSISHIDICTAFVELILFGKINTDTDNKNLIEYIYCMFSAIQILC